METTENISPDRRALLTSDQLADEIGVRPETLRQWRAHSKGPKWFRLPGTRRVLYARDDVESFIAAARGIQYVTIVPSFKGGQAAIEDGLAR